MRSKKRGALSGVSPSELADSLLQEDVAKPLAVVAPTEPEPKPEPPAPVAPTSSVAPASLAADEPPEEPEPSVQRHSTAGRRSQSGGARKAKPAAPPMMVEPPKRGHAIQASGRVVRRITLSLPTDIGQVLAHYCVENGRTQSDVVAEALREKFG